MHHQATAASEHVFCVERKRGPQWYCKYRTGGKQVHRTGANASRATTKRGFRQGVRDPGTQLVELVLSH